MKGEKSRSFTVALIQSKTGGVVLTLSQVANKSLDCSSTQDSCDAFQMYFGPLLIRGTPARYSRNAHYGTRKQINTGIPLPHTSSQKTNDNSLLSYSAADCSASMP